MTPKQHLDRLAGLRAKWAAPPKRTIIDDIREVIREELASATELRRAALEVVCRMERWHAGGTDDDFEQLGKAVDALKEELAR